MGRNRPKLEDSVMDQLRMYKAKHGLTYNEAIGKLLNEVGFIEELPDFLPTGSRAEDGRYEVRIKETTPINCDRFHDPGEARVVAIRKSSMNSMKASVWDREEERFLEPEDYGDD